MKTPPAPKQKGNRLLLLAAVAVLPLSAMAQDEGPQGGPPMGPPPGQRPPPPPIMVALDTNKDGTLSASEIANASDALKSLDANNDGQLTQNELRPPPPPRQGPGGQQQGKQNQNGGQQGQ